MTKRPKLTTAQRGLISTFTEIAGDESPAAHTFIVQAADDAAPDTARAAERNDDIEEAHTELLWAQAQFITAAKEDRARRAVDAAKLKERQVLRRFGFSSFRDYLTARTSVPTTDVHLEVARREFESAQADWDLIAQELADAEVVAPATVVLDLTGDNPRRIA